jgi:ribosomal-protein-alanine N-acetyltransferase
MQWARELGATTIELEVRESNAAARGLYRRMEFVEQGRRAKYYSKPPEDAVLMAAKL